MKHYIYPANLRRAARKWLWSLPAAVGLMLLLTGGVLALAFLHSFLLLGVAAVMALLTAHVSEATLWEYGCCAVRFFLGQQMFFPEEEKENRPS